VTTAYRIDKKSIERAEGQKEVGWGGEARSVFLLLNLTEPSREEGGSTASLHGGLHMGPSPLQE
jgi:hypothetical protein